MNRSAWIFLAWGALTAVGACQVLSGGDGFTFGAGGAAAGGGEAKECAVPEDCPGPATTCRYRICLSGACDVENAVATTPCSESGGTRCDGAGNCVECLGKDDCLVESEDCQGFLCVPTHCFDEALSGNETGVDCGGDCAPCSSCGGCRTADDCASGVCAEGEGCGGAGAGGAGLGGFGGGLPTGGGGATMVCQPCLDHPDCQAGKYCDAGRGICVPTLDQGLACSDGAMCSSGFCTDGVCCETACGTQCYDCAFAKTGQTSGLCAPTKKCDNDGCPFTSACNGNGQCAVLTQLTGCN
jgi:hypothetical protein